MTWHESTDDITEDVTSLKICQNGFDMQHNSNKIQNWKGHICLSAQSIVHLTAQIQIMETRVANFVWGCTGPYFGPTNTISTKNYQKNTRGPIFRKTTQNALQCTTVHCNVASYLLAPNGSNMTQNDPEWLTMPRDDIPEVKGAPGGHGCARGHRGHPW